MKNKKSLLLIVGLLVVIVVVVASSGWFVGEHIGEVEHNGYVCKDTITLCQEGHDGRETCDYYCDTEDYEEVENESYI